MSSSATYRYAFRSLRRNRRRTMLSVVGIGMGVAISLIFLAWIGGERQTMLRAAAYSGVGHARIAPAGWTDSRDLNLRLASTVETLAEIRALAQVEVATPRVRTQGLLAMGNRVASPEITGVDPATESAALRFAERVTVGRYLQPGDEGVVVVGRALADTLDVEHGDELVATVMDPAGELSSRLLEVVGVVETGSRAIDSGFCHVTLQDAEGLSGRSGLGEIAVIFNDPTWLQEGVELLASMAEGDDEALAWNEVSPEVSAGVDADAAFANLITFIILFIVLLGIASSRLTAVLQRRKEFSVLRALGMPSGKMLKLLLTEGVLVGLSGACLSLVVSLPLIYYLADVGVNLADLMGDADLAVSGVLMEPVMYAHLGGWVVPYAFGMSMIATVIASLYPAWYAIRTEPAAGLRVDR